MKGRDDVFPDSEKMERSKCASSKVCLCKGERLCLPKTSEKTK